MVVAQQGCYEWKISFHTDIGIVTEEIAVDGELNSYYQTDKSSQTYDLGSFYIAHFLDGKLVIQFIKPDANSGGDHVWVETYSLDQTGFTEVVSGYVNDSPLETERYVKQ